MSAKTDTWHTTISMLLLSFRKSLVAILPYMDAVKIGWKDDVAYDDWDEISSSLYRNIVSKSIQHSVECPKNLQLAPYDLLMTSYEQYMYIVVSCTKYDDLLFIGFSTQKEPFDSVKCVSTLQNLTVDGEILYVPINECSFSVMFGNDDGDRLKLDEISIEL